MATKEFLPRRLKAAAMLLLCVAMSATMLFSRLVGYAAEDPRHYIPLTRSEGITQVITGTVDANGVFHAESLRTPGRSPLLAASIDQKFQFAFENGNALWKGVSDLEIFKTNYDGTVVSATGDKVIAPGTSNTYTFALENTASGDLDYEVSVKAVVSPGGYDIPVVAKLTQDVDGKYLYGSAAQWGAVEAMNVSDAGTLGKDKIMPYTLSWQWPFEGDDAADTWLGCQEGVTLTIIITTYASYAPPTAVAGGIPKTGDTSSIGMWFTVMLGSAAGLMFLFLLPLRKKEEEDEQV